MEKIKIGIIGCGYMAQMVHLPCLKSVKSAEIIALCDFRESVSVELCRRWDIPHHTDSVDELLSMDVDAVYVLTPVQWHLNNIKAALDAGKHVFTEKPAAMSVKSALELDDAAVKAGKSVVAGYMKRHEANLAELKRLQAESDWGEMLFIRAHSFIGSHWNAAINDLAPVVGSDEAPPAFNPALLDPAPGWLREPRTPEFYSFDHPYYALLDTGCHSVNLLRYLAGKEAGLLSVRNANGVRLIDFDFGGIPGTMEFCVNFKMHRWDEITELYFEEASIRILTPPPLDMQASAVVEIYDENGSLRRNLALGNNHQWAFRLQAENFIERVLAGDRSSDLKDAGKDIAIIEEIYQMEKGI